MSHGVEKRNGQGWRQAGHCLFFALEVNCSPRDQTSSESWEGQGAFNMI